MTEIVFLFWLGLRILKQLRVLGLLKGICLNVSLNKEKRKTLNTHKTKTEKQPDIQTNLSYIEFQKH